MTQKKVQNCFFNLKQVLLKWFDYLRHEVIFKCFNYSRNKGVIQRFTTTTKKVNNCVFSNDDSSLFEYLERLIKHLQQIRDHQFHIYKKSQLELIFKAGKNLINVGFYTYQERKKSFATAREMLDSSENKLYCLGQNIMGLVEYELQDREVRKFLKRIDTERNNQNNT